MYKPPQRNALIYLALLALFLLNGCSTINKLEQPVISDFITLDDQTSLGQSGMARYNGLRAILIYLQPQTPGEGVIQFALRSSPADTTNLRTATLPASEITTPGYYRFEFSPIPQTTLRDIFFLLKYEGSGSVQAGIAPGSAYLYGSLYQKKTPQDVQMAFSAAYNARTAALGLLKEGLGWLGYLFAGGLLFVLPGWALLSALWPTWNRIPWTERLGLAGGSSLVIYPMLFLWTNLIGLNLGLLYAWLPVGTAIGILILKNLPRKHSPSGNWQSIKRRLLECSLPRSIAWVDLAFVAVLGLITLVRFWEVRNLEIPLWGDSYQHTMIAQLLVDNAGLFTSWQPYAELQTFTYHFGFHSLVAVFHWITRISLPQATLVTGQIINILAVASLAPLAARLGRSRWSGVAAIFIAGLWLQMPNFYTNWGRYTQLTGLAVLAVLAWLVWAYMESREHHWGVIHTLWLILGGLALTHYRVALMAVLFFPALWVAMISKSTWKQLARKTVLLGLGSFMVFLPWFMRAFSSNLVRWLSFNLQSKVQPNTSMEAYVFNLRSFTEYLPAGFWLVMILVIIIGVLRRDKGTPVLALWWLLILLAANPQWLNLPSKDILDNFAVLISAYFPAAILIGAGTGWLIEKLGPWFSSLPSKFPSLNPVLKWLPILSISALLLVGIWYARVRLYDIKIPQFALALRPDLRAARWISENTSAEDVFLVNSFFAYSDSVIVGSDGGWWLPLLAKRKTTLPPLTYGIEQGPEIEYRVSVNQLAGEILKKGVSHPDVLKLLSERSISYIYIGQQQGTVNFSGTFLEINKLLGDKHFTPVYHQDRVWIFRFNP